jgi:uncharacterized OsmC-like protein
LAERVIVRQNREYEIEVLAADPHSPDAEGLQPVEMIYQLTPYGLLLAGLGACTAVVLNTYADYHEVGLEQVELRLSYDRTFDEDCEHCQSIDDYQEQIEMRIVLEGDLTAAERQKLFAISKHCPIHKMLAQGIEVKTSLVEEAPATSAPAQGGEK